MFLNAALQESSCTPAKAASQPRRILRASPPAAGPLQLFFLAWQLSALGPILLSDRFHAWMITYSRICGLCSRLRGLGSRIRGLSSRIRGLGTQIRDLRCRIGGLGAQIHGLGSRICGLGSRISGLGSLSCGLAGSLGSLARWLAGLLACRLAGTVAPWLAGLGHGAQGRKHWVRGWLSAGAGALLPSKQYSKQAAKHQGINV